MKTNFNKPKYNRQSYRLKNYDYSSEGLYFVTVCTYNKDLLFVEVVDGIVILSDLGQIAHEE